MLINSLLFVIIMSLSYYCSMSLQYMHKVVQLNSMQSSQDEMTCFTSKFCERVLRHLQVDSLLAPHSCLLTLFLCGGHRFYFAVVPYHILLAVDFVHISWRSWQLECTLKTIRKFAVIILPQHIFKCMV